jgi:hypothetical protein
MSFFQEYSARVSAFQGNLLRVLGMCISILADVQSGRVIPSLNRLPAQQPTIKKRRNRLLVGVNSDLNLTHARF